MKTEVINNSRMPIDASWVKKVTRFLRAEGYPSAQWPYKTLTLVFLDRAQARRVNLQFRKKDYATDILSFAPSASDFPSADEASVGADLGELVLCPQVIRAQAKEHGLSFETELAYMLIHGVLHLLGYEHEGRTVKAKARARKMMKLQDQLFDRLCKKFDLS